jgi:hypothetical protein
VGFDVHNGHKGARENEKRFDDHFFQKQVGRTIAAKQSAL